MKKQILVLMLSASVAQAQSAPKKAMPKRNVTPTIKAEPVICAKLSDDYEEASKRLGLLNAENIADDSAPRAAVRENQANTIISQATMTMNIMVANGCKSPTYVPSADHYIIAANACAQGIIKRRIKETLRNAGVSFVPLGQKPLPEPMECDTGNWQRDTARAN